MAFSGVANNWLFQCEEMFDCYPAVAAAFKHSKIRAEVNLEEEKSQPAEDTVRKPKIFT